MLYYSLVSIFYSFFKAVNDAKCLRASLIDVQMPKSDPLLRIMHYVYIYNNFQLELVVHFPIEERTDSFLNYLSVIEGYFSNKVTFS